jgi:hypothetical protein
VLNLAAGEGALRLQSANPAVQPLLDFNFLSEAFDRQRLRDSLRMCVELSRYDEFGPILGDRIAPTDEEAGA